MIVRRHRRRVAASLAALTLVGGGARLDAQATIGWQRSAQLSANVWYGAAHTRVVSSEVEMGHTDSSFSVRATMRFGYADDREDNGPRQVTARSNEVTLGADYRPFDRYSPFILAGGESSFQQRIALRTSAGLGAKRTLLHKNRDDLSISLALLTERTVALEPPDSSARIATRTRWSWRFRYRRQLTPTLYVSHVTFYQPAVEHAATRYTVDATTSLEAAITSAVSLTATLRDRYDSESRSRGAPSDNDGQFLLGLRARF
ncbi:MAG TPA: DUF481 domain-containing protein [Gemmatimonadaceae bacterium]